MTRLLSCIGIAGLLGIAGHGVPGDETPPPILVVGDFANPPFSSWSEAREPVGIEVEILDLAGKELGRPVSWRELPFAEMLPAVERGEAHVAASTIGITDERARRVRFSESYHETELSVVVRAGAGEPAGLADLGGRRVGAGRATTSEDAVRRSLPDATLVVERDGDLTFGEMLLAGKLGAIVMDRPAARRLLSDNPGRITLLNDHLGLERYAFAVHRDETAILDAIDAMIRRLRAEGRFEAWAAEHDRYE